MKSRDRFNIRYIVSQKDSLERLHAVMGGYIDRNKTYNAESVVLQDYSGGKGVNTQKAVDYIEKFPLRTTKWNSFLI